MSGILAGLRVIEGSAFIAAPMAGMTLAQFALRWILMFEAVTCAIPGAKRPAQAEENVRAAEFPALSADALKSIRSIYDRHIRTLVHQTW